MATYKPTQQIFVFLHTVLDSLPISSTTHLSYMEQLYNHQQSIQGSTVDINKTNEFELHVFPALSCTAFLALQIPSIAQNTSLVSIYAIAISSAVALLITGITFLCLPQRKFPSPIGLGISALIAACLYFIPLGNDGITVYTGIIVGIAQSMALQWGLSRMLATYATMLLFGIAPTTAFIFSTWCHALLAWPATILAYTKKGVPALQPVWWYIQATSIPIAIGLFFYSLWLLQNASLALACYLTLTTFCSLLIQKTIRFMHRTPQHSTK